MSANSLMQRSRQAWWDFISFLQNPRRRRQITRILTTAIALLLVVMVILMLWWSRTPAPFDPQLNAQHMATEQQHELVTGYVSVATLITLTDTLLSKPGGYLSNDVMPPSVWMDNMPNWEYGVLTQIRDFSTTLRTSIARDKTQTLEDEDLAIADPALHFDAHSWLFPPTEQELRRGIRALHRYQARLSDPEATAHFHAEADTLRIWLEQVEKRLNSLSEHLANSVGQQIVTTDITPVLTGDSEQSSEVIEAVRIVKTPRFKVDDIFYEARGSSWALLHLLQAIETDFYDVLQDKNALNELRQIIRELEATQRRIWSPFILNGTGFGLFANHSLIMASHITRANTAVTALRQLLEQG